ncbi:DUF2971 domain-containing protein [Kangiella koreensis]|uniref:DUF2971 domain-containing protein n=1 Tax=Kangiella koreensis (strain DSM 16069 / JCM 12317 / KCTC 12182 / SW-125) TaxID=523791 RepID=C7R9R3_KANKD|nr:DUF2971 domain-containing protein [Kangiella koreensis]ACV27932.1 hypothetical protein Kkor_2523 [Kangiella koreensis DSM 16069]
MNFDYIYKFHKVTDHSKKALLNRKIWLSTQESLNDPFEGVTKTIYPTDRTDLITKCVNYMTEMLCDEENLEKSHAQNIVLQRYLENPDGFLEIVLEQAKKEHNSAIEHTRNLGIYSTSADIPNDERSHIANMIMWSLYADGFKGFCIKYNAKELYRSLRELNSEDKFSYTKVNYVTQPYEVDLFSLVHKDNIAYLKALQFKHEQWEHECECRILSTSAGLKEISQNSIEAIYFGDKISEQNEIGLIEIMQQSFPNTPIFRVKLDSQSYGIRVGEKI